MQEVSITDIYIVVDLSYFNFLNSFLETYTHYRATINLQ